MITVIIPEHKAEGLDRVALLTYLQERGIDIEAGYRTVFDNQTNARVYTQERKAV